MQYIYCKLYVFLVCVFYIRLQFRTSKMEHKMDIFAKILHGYGPSTIFVKNSISDVPLSLNATLQVASHC